MSEMEPDSTTKNLRRHTIQLPGPVIQKHPMEEQQSPIPGEAHQVSVEHGRIPIPPGHGTLHGQIPIEASSSEETKSPTEIGKEECSGRSSLSGRIPRQITQPELGSWKMGGLQREAPGNVVGEVSFLKYLIN